MKVYRSEMPNIFDRIISIVSYLTMGLVGVIWMMICHFLGKPPMPFVKYHIIQSLFIGICITLFQIILSILVNAISIIPPIAGLVQNLIYYIALYPLIFDSSLLKIFIVSFYIYVIITIINGKYTEVPWFSDMVRKLA